MAQRIRARAIRRAGELLKQLDGKGNNQHTDASDSKLTQKEAARAAGMSERQQVTAAVAKEIGERRGRPSPEKVENIPQYSGEKTRDIAARASGFGNGKTLYQAKSVITAGTPELVAAMDTGKVSISAAASSFCQLFRTPIASTRKTRHTGLKIDGPNIIHIPDCSARYTLTFSFACLIRRSRNAHASRPSGTSPPAKARQLRKTQNGRRYL